jgi:uncharacterized protein (DUF433 family)
MTPLPKAAILLPYEMARKKITRVEGDVREHPRYSIDEAAFYLHIPKATLRAWIRGRRKRSASGRVISYLPVIQPADEKNRLLSFNNLAEAHVLRCTRERNIPLKNVRMALEYVRESLSQHPHPLLTREFSSFGKDIFITHLGQTVNATKQGQLAMRKLLGKYLERLKRDRHGDLLEIYPVQTRILAINPLISSGRPIVKGTGISAAILRDRLSSGESRSEVAEDYGLSIRELKQAVEEFAAA